MPKVISLSTAVDLWAHLSEQFDSEIVDKNDSALMDSVAWMLDGMGILDKEAFLQSYGTTIFDTIFIPFIPGEAGRWDAVSQCSMAIHEHEHVRQADAHGALTFAARYLGKPSSRAHYEAEAYRTNMEFYFWLTGIMPSPAYYAQKILNYGCGRDEVDYIRAFLEMSVPAIEAGEQLSPVSRCALRYLAERC